MLSKEREIKKSAFSDSTIYWSAVLIIGTGVWLGILWAWHEFLTKPPPTELVYTEVPSNQLASGFGQYFSLFFLGRTGNESRVRRSSPLIRSGKFLPNERVGIRAETSESVRSRFAVDLRFLTRAAREEPDFLKRYRQRIRINPGRWSYCCVKMPKEAGNYDLGVLVEKTFIGYLPIQVKRPVQYQDDR